MPATRLKAALAISILLVEPLPRVRFSTCRRPGSYRGQQRVGAHRHVARQRAVAGQDAADDFRVGGGDRAQTEWSVALPRCSVGTASALFETTEMVLAASEPCTSSLALSLTLTVPALTLACVFTVSSAFELSAMVLALAVPPRPPTAWRPGSAGSAGKTACCPR